ncbi:hypothetical protein B0H12DRAFT_1126340 [Mycena haematopus]|nr:hypothetical protein B0H12DRAFT_1126340 [Mycena haematopus]
MCTRQQPVDQVLHQPRFRSHLGGNLTELNLQFGPECGSGVGDVSPGPTNTGQDNRGRAVELGNAQ